MRARFSVETTLDSGEMHAVFNELHWIPNLQGDNGIEQSRAETFIADLPIDDDTQSLVRETFCFLIFDYSSSVWGIVNEPTRNVYTIRLGHGNIETLRHTAHQQLEQLLQIRGEKIKLADNGNVKFFERDGSNETMSARYHISQNLSSLLKNKKQAVWSAIITILLGALTTYISHPESFVEPKLALFGADSGNMLFWEQFSGRVATAFFVGAILALYDVIFYIRTQRNSPSITLRSDK